MPASTRLRARRRIASCLLLAGAHLLLPPRSDPAAPSNDDATSDAGPIDGDFALCGRTLRSEDVPRAPPHGGGRSFGVQNWTRDLKRGVVLAPDVGGHRMVDGVRVEKVYGRTGNQIQEFFRAFDLARDRGGALVVHGEGFPLDLTLRQLYLGLDNATVLAEKFGVAFYEELEEVDRGNLREVWMEEAYHYVGKHEGYNLADAIEHRKYVIQELYRTTAREMELHPDSPGVATMCSSLHSFFGRDDGMSADEDELRKLGVTKEITKKYTVIHSRKLEAMGARFMAKAHEVFGVDARAAMDLPPDLIRTILSPLGMDTSSVLMITDGQSKDPIDRLLADPHLGPHVQVVPSEISTLTGDIMLAILADVFVGSPVSTFSMYIAQARYALGIGNSYLFHRRDAEGTGWETFCNDEACLYHWMEVFVPLF